MAKGKVSWHEGLAETVLSHAMERAFAAMWHPQCADVTQLPSQAQHGAFRPRSFLAANKPMGHSVTLWTPPCTLKCLEDARTRTPD